MLPGVAAYLSTLAQFFFWQKPDRGLAEAAQAAFGTSGDRTSVVSTKALASARAFCVFRVGQAGRRAAAAQAGCNGRSGPPHDAKFLIAKSKKRRRCWIRNDESLAAIRDKKKRKIVILAQSSLKKNGRSRNSSGLARFGPIFLRSGPRDGGRLYAQLMYVMYVM